jgi:hypothetical protein
MIKARTHFDQVSLAIVKKIVEEQIRREPTLGLHHETKKMPLKEDLLKRQKFPLAGPRTVSSVEVEK